MPVSERVVADPVLDTALDANEVGSDVVAMSVGSFVGLPVADDVVVLVVQILT